MKEKDLAIMEQFRKCIPIFSVLNDAKRQEIYDKDIHHYYIDKQDAYVSNTLQIIRSAISYARSSKVFSPTFEY